MKITNGTTFPPVTLRAIYEQLDHELDNVKRDYVSFDEHVIDSGIGIDVGIGVGIDSGFSLSIILGLSPRANETPALFDFWNAYIGH